LPTRPRRRSRTAYSRLRCRRRPNRRAAAVASRSARAPLLQGPRDLQAGVRPLRHDNARRPGLGSLKRLRSMRAWVSGVQRVSHTHSGKSQNLFFLSQPLAQRTERIVRSGPHRRCAPLARWYLHARPPRLKWRGHRTNTAAGPRCQGQRIDTLCCCATMSRTHEHTQNQSDCWKHPSESFQ
jgi:hypothetical protein